MSEAAQQVVQRQTAYITSIQSLLQGEFVQQEGWEPNYVHTQQGQKVSRIHIVGTVIETTSPLSFQVDDGSGTIEVRDFESNPVIENLQVGSIVRVIAKVREYQSSRYLFPEVVIVLEDTTWVQVHKEMMQRSLSKAVTSDVVAPSEPDAPQEEKEEDILPLIDSLDKGEGVPVVDIVAAVQKQSEKNKEDITSAIQELLLQGEIFEIKPDVVKVLK